MDKGTTDLIGQEWQNLMCAIRQSGGEGDGEPTKLESWRQKGKEKEDGLQDVKRLKHRDMALFGRCPETDLFYTVVCSLCSMVLMPHALREHIERRHGHSQVDEDSPSCKAKAKLVKLSQGKPEKFRRIRYNSSSPPDLTEDIKRCPKKSKSPERTIPPELEPMLPNRLDKRKQKLVVNQDLGEVPELQPIVPLSPVIPVIPEKEVVAKDVPKKQKKKGEKKADKVYDPNKNCGVVNDTGKPCLRSILCKVHQVALKRAVPNRSMPYDTLTKMLKSQGGGGEDRVKVEVRPKVEQEEPPDTPFCIVTIPALVKEEPPPKKLKVEVEEEEIAVEETDPGQYALPSYLEALIEETLKNAEENEPLPLIPMVPKPEPVVRWNLEPVAVPASPSLPPTIILDDVSWHSTHPKPLATNTFGCRLIGGLMSTCKKLDTLRKHLQSIWSPSTVRSGFNDAYSDASLGNPGMKYAKKSTQSKAVVKKSMVSQGKPSVKRKRKSSLAAALAGSSSVATAHLAASSSMATAHLAASSSASDIISGLLVSNSVPLQRSSGVIPTNGVPLRLFQGSLPVIAPATSSHPSQASQQPTFIQLNLCTPK